MIKARVPVLFAVVVVAAILAAVLSSGRLANDGKNKAGMFSWIQDSTNLVVIGHVEKIQPITGIQIVGGFEHVIKRGLVTMRVDTTVVGNISGEIQFLVANHIYYEDGHPMYQDSPDHPWIVPGDNVIIALKPVELMRELQDNQREKVTMYSYAGFVRFLEHEYDKLDQELFIGSDVAEVGSDIPDYGTSDIDPYSFVKTARKKDTEMGLLEAMTHIKEQAK